ncbi:hypothetical protein B0A49_02734 [Cryomyces minteri]|uniref:alpha-1,2-Mannosidase n=1 Tax=Cryomyces minteri TaxID=331657 RepID=A0A4U0XKZ7_9PEZI|nr:hypothetical protein B0A49_02734 [Cryomyces minteri]
MDTTADFEKAVDAMSGTDFGTSESDSIKVFETTVRYLVTRWDLHKAVRGGAQVADESLLVAEIGSLTLEFTRLFQLSGNPKWYDTVDRITEIFDKQQRMTRLSGTWPIFVSVREADLTQNGAFTLGAMEDSVYKYLPKMHALLGRSAIYEKLYQDSMSAAIHRTFFRPMIPDDADILLAGNIHVDNANQTTLPLNSEDQHLVCFASGMFATGSRLPDHPDHLDIARKLTQRCIWTYRALPSGIMLEVFNLVPGASSDVMRAHLPQDDCMESFWTVESLEHFYLVSSQPDFISLDEYVFNTEAHPFRRPKS